MLVTGVVEQFFCKYISLAITQSFWINNDMTLAATISVPEQYTPDDIQLSLDKIKLNARSLSLLFTSHKCTALIIRNGDIDSLSDSHMFIVYFLVL